MLLEDASGIWQRVCEDAPPRYVEGKCAQCGGEVSRALWRSAGIGVGEEEILGPLVLRLTVVGRCDNGHSYWNWYVCKDEELERSEEEFFRVGMVRLMNLQEQVAQGLTTR